MRDHTDLAPLVCDGLFRSHRRAECEMVGVCIDVSCSHWLDPARAAEIQKMLAESDEG